MEEVYPDSEVTSNLADDNNDAKVSEHERLSAILNHLGQLHNCMKAAHVQY